jgi:hypothetical protein
MEYRKNGTSLIFCYSNSHKLKTELSKSHPNKIQTIYAKKDERLREKIVKK